MTKAKYQYHHQQKRKEYQRVIDAGDGYCQQGLDGNGSSGTCIMASRYILPGEPWALGHNDAGTDWIGPTHAACNQRDGASRGGKAIVAKRRAMNELPGNYRASRNW